MMSTLPHPGPETRLQATLHTLAPLVLVSGKGGVGKSHVASKLAVGFAEAGERVALVRFRHDQARPAPSVPAVTTLTIDPAAALREQAGRVLGSPLLARTVLEHKAIRGVLDLIPGVTEVALLLSIAQLLDGRDARFTRVVVDLPATGHGLGLLRAPATLLGIVDSGRAHALTDDLRARLEDPRRTSFVAVTTTELFVLSETERLVDEARACGVAPSLVVVNRVPAAAPDTARALAQRLGERVGAAPALKALANALAERELVRARLAYARACFDRSLPVVGLELEADVFGRAA